MNHSNEASVKKTNLSIFGPLFNDDQIHHTYIKRPGSDESRMWCCFTSPASWTKNCSWTHWKDYRQLVCTFYTGMRWNNSLYQHVAVVCIRHSKMKTGRARKGLLRVPSWLCLSTSIFLVSSEVNKCDLSCQWTPLLIQYTQLVRLEARVHNSPQKLDWQQRANIGHWFVLL